MNECTYKSFDELPLTLNVVQVAAVLGISRAGAYELVHSEGDAHARDGLPSAADRQPHRGAEGQAAGVDRRQHSAKMTTL